MGARRTPRGRKIGRPPILDPALVDTLIANAALGVPLKQAATLSGIGVSTWHLWRTKGEDEILARHNGQEADRDKDVYVDFVERLARARARVAQRNVANVETAAKGGTLIERTTTTLRDGSTQVTEKFQPPQWQAAKFMLERSFPMDFGPAAVQIEVLPGVDAGPGGVEGATDERDLASRLASHVTEYLAIEQGRPVDGEVEEDGEVVEEGQVA